MSFGYPARPQCIGNAVKQASDQQIVMFAAASNDGGNKGIPFPPSFSSRVICVNSANGLGGASSFNPPPQSGHNFSVLGEAVKSAWPLHLGNKEERRQWGTSTSTPIAAAIAALVMEFARQLPVNIKHFERLKSLEGMSAVFKDMSVLKDGYDYVVPLELLDCNHNDRTLIESRISLALMRLFGLVLTGTE